MRKGSQRVSGERFLVSWEGGSQRQSPPRGVILVAAVFAQGKLGSACLSLEAQGETWDLFLHKLRNFHLILRINLTAEVRASRKHQGMSSPLQNRQGGSGRPRTLPALIHSRPGQPHAAEQASWHSWEGEAQEEHGIAMYYNCH